MLTQITNLLFAAGVFLLGLGVFLLALDLNPYVRKEAAKIAKKSAFVQKISKVFLSLLITIVAANFAFTGNVSAKEHPEQPGKAHQNQEERIENTQGKSKSNPDGGGVDKPNAASGQAAKTQGQSDFDGNNGSGNDTDHEDDNNGKCPKKKCPINPVTNLISTVIPEAKAAEKAQGEILPEAASIGPVGSKVLPETGKGAELIVLTLLSFSLAGLGWKIRSLPKGY